MANINFEDLIGKIKNEQWNEAGYTFEEEYHFRGYSTELDDFYILLSHIWPNGCNRKECHRLSVLEKNNFRDFILNEDSKLVLVSFDGKRRFLSGPDEVEQTLSKLYEQAQQMSFDQMRIASDAEKARKQGLLDKLEGIITK